MLGLLAIVIAYLLGGIPFGFLLVKLTRGTDVRESGSGNIGATNVLRTSGPAAGVATLVLDIAKGYLAVWLAAKLTGDAPEWTSLAALAVMAGHAYPVFLKFQGGKAVATFIGAFAYLTPLPLAAVLLLFIAVVAVTRYISAASILAAATFPFGVWMILHPPVQVTAAAFIAGAFIVYRHKSNWARLRAGTENRVFLGSPVTLSILGGGSWGTALAIVLAPRFERVRLWVFEPDLAARMTVARENDVFLPGLRHPGQRRHRVRFACGDRMALAFCWRWCPRIIREPCMSACFPASTPRRSS